MPNTDSYPYIQAWGRRMGSHRIYVDLEVEAAREDDAPANAVYRTNGRWVTTDDITTRAVRLELGLPPEPAVPPDAQVLLDWMALNIGHNPEIRDQFGLKRIEQMPDAAGFALVFSTGYRAEVTISLSPPSDRT